MLIWLVAFDGKMENLALMRLSAWHKTRGDIVHLKTGVAHYPELFNLPDRVYISCVFRWRRKAALTLADRWGNRAQVGGSGVDIQKTLPPEIAMTPPDYDLYSGGRAIGFISRGCPNKCPWCIVPAKEGRLHRVATAREIVGRQRKAFFLDNNFLAMPGHMDDLAWLAENKIKIDFNQGLEARLVTDENAAQLSECTWDLPGGEKVRLALDSCGKKAALQRAVECLCRAGMTPRDVFVYVLIGYAGLESDLDRLLFARSLGLRVFPMGYRDINTGGEPARGWNVPLYKKYKRLITRIPFGKKIWLDFEREVNR